MLLDTLMSARDLGRLNHIAAILMRFGFGDTVRRLGMSNALKSAGELLNWEEAAELATLEPPQRVRRAMEEMGPSFVKLGQILSTRVDLFPAEYIAEFEKLQDRAPPVPFAEIRAQVEEDVGGSLEEIFAKVEEEALAAASIAQVHRARLKSGEEVVLKVRRPGIRAIVEADLRLLMRLAEIAEEEVKELRRYRPREIAAEFSRSMRLELDLAAECRHAERVAANFKDDADIGVPKVYWDWTCEQLNVQEFIDGIPGRDLERVDRAGLDRKVIAERGADAVLKMIFQDGFFHADPHPGNVFYLPGNRIVFVDFGMVGRLTAQRQHQLVEVLTAVVQRRARPAVHNLLLWADEDEEIDEAALTRDVEAFIDRVHATPLKAFNLPQVVTEWIAVMRGHDLVLPPDLSMLIKAFLSLEGMARQLDPDFDVMEATKPYLERAALAYYAPTAVLSRSREEIAGLAELMASLPGDVAAFMRSTRKKGIELKVDIERTERLIQHFDRALSRLTLGILIAAVVIGSSIVMTAAGGQTPIGLSFFAMLGFVAAVAGSVWMIISMWRRR
ncbi:ABC1 kinase family protein [Afifella pfennigii]|uniref:ABC1 kinase family protein n=1 Tax=Afifella pfennigii TaxID=209897 RepID=UPI000478D237|nr:AarF/UbiB family protein [Afifella pfennigii]